MQERKDNDLRIPDVEIVINAAGSDVAVVAFYFPGNPHEQAEIVATITDASARTHLVAVLYQAISIINGEDWFTLAELDTGDVQTKDEPPF